jgi:hypothetical protein
MMRRSRTVTMRSWRNCTAWVRTGGQRRLSSRRRMTTVRRRRSSPRSLPLRRDSNHLPRSLLLSPRRRRIVVQRRNRNLPSPSRLHPLLWL